MTLDHPLAALYSHPVRDALSGRAKIGGDKSMSHRALMLGLLTREETIISGLLESGDILATAAACTALGAHISNGGDGLWRIHGVGVGKIAEPDHVIDLGNSGTSARLLSGIIAAHDISAVITGDASLQNRPMARIIEPLSQMGASFIAREGGRMPLAIRGTKSAKPIAYRMKMASAQVKSAILLAALHANGETCVIEPVPTRDHTEHMLRHFGADITSETQEDGAHIIRVNGPHILRGCAVDIPGDPSAAAFVAVAAALSAHTDTSITMARILYGPRRNGLFVKLAAMGADITITNERTEQGEVIADIGVGGGAPLHAIDIPPEDIPAMIDECPILAIAAACAQGTTRMRGLGELRVKESDRLHMIAHNLTLCGASVEIEGDDLLIHGTGKPPAGGAMLACANDHRIAMSFLILGSVTDQPVGIDDSRTIATSFPSFTKIMNELGLDIAPPPAL